jgi:hypothetical protein
MLHLTFTYGIAKPATNKSTCDGTVSKFGNQLGSEDFNLYKLAICANRLTCQRPRLP